MSEPGHWELIPAVSISPSVFVASFSTTDAQVPDLTFDANINLNERLSLQRREERISCYIF